MNLLAVLYASYHNQKVANVTGILAKQGIEYKLYGEGQWRGFGEKLLAAHEAATTMTSYTHILFLDAHDTICLGRAGEILERFVSFQHPWVCCSEVGCWPDAYRAEKYPPCDTPWRYLNSGAYLAERKYLADCLGRWGGSGLSPHLDDQRFLTDYYLGEPGSILLDTGCRLFQSLMGGFHLFTLSSGKLHNQSTDTDPLVLHWNGGGNIEEVKILWA